MFAGSFFTVNANDVHWLILPGAGNIGRNIGNGPGFANVDLRVSKKFNLGNIKKKDDSRKKDERSADLEFRLDSFNVFNHVNARSFIGTLSSPFFGRANSAYRARELQASVSKNLWFRN